MRLMATIGILTAGVMMANQFGIAPVAAAETPAPAELRHVVLFKFKDSCTPAMVQEVVDAFAALPAKIPTITGFEHGTDISVENKAAGYTHAFIVSFKTTKDRDDYLPHPAHAEFVKLVGPRLDQVLVLDFFVKTK